VQSLKFVGCGTGGHQGAELHDLSTFECRTDWFKPFGRAHKIFIAGDTAAPPVILLHELPGMTRHDVDLA